MSTTSGEPAIVAPETSVPSSPLLGSTLLQRCVSNLLLTPFGSQLTVGRDEAGCRQTEAASLLAGYSGQAVPRGSL